MDHLNRLTPAILIFAAAVIFAGSLVWFGLRSSPSASSASALRALPTTGISSSTPEQGPVPGVPIFHTPVVGLVGAVGSDSITVAAVAQGTPGVPTSTSTVTTVVEVNSSTNIYKEGPLKSTAEFQQEGAAFRAKIQDADPSITYVGPDPYTHVALTLSDIAVGDVVDVIPTQDQQTLGDTVTAASIEVTPAPAANATPATQ